MPGRALKDVKRIAMEFKLLLLSLAALLSPTVATLERSVANKQKTMTRVVNGKSVDITTVPYQVLIMNDILTFVQQPICGGSIITDRFVLSAAHCFPKKIFPVSVRAGSRYSTEGGQVIYAKETYVHPEYDKRYRRYHDFAMVHLLSSLIFNQFVAPAKLPHDFSFQVPVGGKVTVSGWGQTHEKIYKSSPELLSASMKNLDPDRCVKYFGKRNLPLDPEFILCVDVDKVGKDACSGDSGGPLTYNSILVGVVSFGEGCGREGVPGVYGRVATGLGWFHSLMQNVTLAEKREKLTNIK